MHRFRLTLLAVLGCVLTIGAKADGQPPEITPANIAGLNPAWTTVMTGGAHKGVTPILDGQSLFVPNSTGNLYRIDTATGAVIWEIALAKALDIPGATGAKGVAVTDDALIFGLRTAATVVAIRKDTGALLWKTGVDDFHGAVMTQTPIVVDGKVYIGVSGLGEEVAATTPPYHCCGFRGSVLALDANTGKILWKRYVVPEGFAGASVWSSAPLFDARRHTLYITTGNAFRVPSDVQACVDAHRGNAKDMAACYPQGVWYDSILALDPDSGAIKWGFRAEDGDIFTGACLVRIGGFCGGGDDLDFGNGALQWHADGQDFVGAGQKSGVFWALAPDSGKLLWTTRLGPGGPNGGIEYGSAVEDGRVYVAEGNTKQVAHDPGTYTLPSGQTINYGSYAALDAATGRILWQVPDPAGARHFDNGQPCTATGPRENCTGAFPKGAVTVANGIVYGCSIAPTGPLYAFDAATGQLLWTFETGTLCDSRPATDGHRLYWVVGNTIHAFAVGAAAPQPVKATGAAPPMIGLYSSEQAVSGKALYQANCATGCHNANLAGGGPVPDLAGPGFLGRWAGLKAGDLFERTRATMPKTRPGSLADADYLAIVAYILSANGFPAGPFPLQPAQLGQLPIAPPR